MRSVAHESQVFINIYSATFLIDELILPSSESALSFTFFLTWLILTWILIPPCLFLLLLSAKDVVLVKLEAGDSATSTGTRAAASRRTRRRRRKNEGTRKKGKIRRDLRDRSGCNFLPFSLWEGRSSFELKEVWFRMTRSKNWVAQTQANKFGEC